MSSRYTADGRRISSMTHARRGRICELCERVVYGNGGKVSHGRSHVKRGEAVEMVKEYGYGQSTSRIFVPATDAEAIADLLSRGFEEQR